MIQSHFFDFGTAQRKNTGGVTKIPKESTYVRLEATETVFDRPSSFWRKITFFAAWWLRKGPLMTHKGPQRGSEGGKMGFSKFSKILFSVHELQNEDGLSLTISAEAKCICQA